MRKTQRNASNATICAIIHGCRFARNAARARADFSRIIDFGSTNALRRLRAFSCAFAQYPASQPTPPLAADARAFATSRTDAALSISAPTRNPLRPATRRPTLQKGMSAGSASRGRNAEQSRVHRAGATAGVRVCPEGSHGSLPWIRPASRSSLRHHRSRGGPLRGRARQVAGGRNGRRQGHAGWSRDRRYRPPGISRDPNAHPPRERVEARPLRSSGRRPGWRAATSAVSAMAGNRARRAADGDRRAFSTSVRDRA